MIRTVRIFLSSPGDVAAERAQAHELLLGLARGPFVRGRVHIDVVSWDDPQAPAPMDARFTPQQAVDRRLPMPAECDLTIVLLWGRMGTPLAEKKADDPEAPRRRLLRELRRGWGGHSAGVRHLRLRRRLANATRTGRE